ncbi:MAG: NUDIX hydrolase [Candidatus Altiarchaeota archaeon]|nr:NUDIX hydrolase [Candidatus Altiarchaeota archaeon]
MVFKAPSLTVDGVVVDRGRVVLIKRRFPPFAGSWALPGGFVDAGESVEQAVVREVFEETSLKARVVRLVGVYSKPNRDPRRHTVSVCFLCKRKSGVLNAGSDSKEACWFRLDELPKLAFDHADMIRDAKRLLVG